MRSHIVPALLALASGAAAHAVRHAPPPPPPPAYGGYGQPTSYAQPSTVTVTVTMASNATNATICSCPLQTIFTTTLNRYLNCTTTPIPPPPGTGSTSPVGPVTGPTTTPWYPTNSTMPPGTGSTTPWHPYNTTTPSGTGTSPPTTTLYYPWNATTPSGTGTAPPGTGTAPPGTGSMPTSSPPYRNSTAPPGTGTVPTGNFTQPTAPRSGKPPPTTSPPWTTNSTTPTPPWSPSSAPRSGSSAPPAYSFSWPAGYGSSSSAAPGSSSSSSSSSSAPPSQPTCTPSTLPSRFFIKDTSGNAFLAINYTTKQLTDAPSISAATVFFIQNATRADLNGAVAPQLAFTGTHRDSDRAEVYAAFISSEGGAVKFFPPGAARAQNLDIVTATFDTTSCELVLAAAEEQGLDVPGMCRGALSLSSGEPNNGCVSTTLTLEPALL